ncbi:MAG: asparagine synthetase B family protein [Halarcobacter sp.]
MHSFLSILSLKKQFIKDDLKGFSHTFSYNHSLFEKNHLILSNSNINNIQTYKSQSKKISIIFNGRIYNKKELKKYINHNSCIDIDNTKLILELYLKYGQECVDKIIGDWSLLIYDFEKEEYFIAQDHHGYTAVYYYVDSDYIIVSTSIRLIKKIPFIDLTIDIEKAIGRDAIVYLSEDDSTFYKNLKVLNPAHRAWLNKKEIKKERYWFPEKIKVDYSITLNQAIEELNEIFTEAVRCRIQSDKPIASMLSGGLDSTSVSTVASELLKKENQTLHTYSHVPQYNIRQDLIGDRNGDESANMKAVIEKCGNIDAHFLNSAQLTPLEGLRLSLEVFNEPIHATINAYWLMDIYSQVSKNSHEVLLSGETGNATTSYTGINYLLDSDKLYEIYGLKSLIKNKLLRPIYSRYYKPFTNMLKKTMWSDYSYLNPSLDIQIKQLIKKSKRNEDFSFYFTKDDEKELMKKILMLGFNKRCEFGANASQYFNINLADPTGDKRVIEYMLKLPNELYISKENKEKNIIKHLMKDRLPDKVLHQKNKGLQSADIIDRIQKDIPEIESIINDFKTDLIDIELFDKKRLLADLNTLKKKELSAMNTHLLFKSVGIMEFLNYNAPFFQDQ